MKDKEWIGVDLDGTLAQKHPDGWQGISHIGEPIPLMVDRVKKWLAEGKTVKILTARFAEPDLKTREQVVFFIRQWCVTYIGQRLEVTCSKDMHMTELWDDRARQVETGTGRVAELGNEDPDPPHADDFHHYEKPFIKIDFQEGPVKEAGVNGCQNEDVVKILIHRLGKLQAAFPCDENEQAISHLEWTLDWLEARTKKRVEQGVEGENKPHIS